MTQEVEMKLAVDDQIDWSSRLSSYPTLKPRFFEDNFLFDKDSHLMKQSSVLRVRLEGSQWVVTLIMSSVMPAASAYCGRCQIIVATIAPMTQLHASAGWI